MRTYYLYPPTVRWAGYVSAFFPLGILLFRLFWWTFFTPESIRFDVDQTLLAVSGFLVVMLSLSGHCSVKLIGSQRTYDVDLGPAF